MTYATMEAIIITTRKQNATMIRSDTPLLPLPLVFDGEEGQLILITFSEMLWSSSG